MPLDTTNANTNCTEWFVNPLISQTRKSFLSIKKLKEITEKLEKEEPKEPPKRLEDENMQLLFNLMDHDDDNGTEIVAIYKKDNKLHLEINKNYEGEAVTRFLEDIILRYEECSKVSNVINVKNQLTSAYLLLRKIMDSIKSLDEKTKVKLNYRQLMANFQRIEDLFI